MFKYRALIAAILLISCAHLSEPAYSHEPGDPPGYAGPQCDIDYVPYIHAVEDRAKRHWHASKKDRQMMVYVKFKIMPTGKVEDASIERSSGNERADKAALKAVTRSARFGELPAGSSDHLRVRLIFNGTQEPCVRGVIFPPQGEPQ